MAIKIKKFEHDTRDYLNNKVYTWAEEQRNRRPPSKRTQIASSMESVTSDGYECRPKYKVQREGGKYTKSIEKASKPFLAETDDCTTSSGEQSTLHSKTKYNKKTTNISSKTLTSEQCKIMNKGLNFEPTQQLDQFHFPISTSFARLCD